MSDTLTLDEERDLIAQAKTNPDMFRRLYRHYLPRVYAYVAHRVGRKQDAEDLVSDIFLNVVKALPQFDHHGGYSFAAWVFRIASNRIADFYRQNQSRIIALDDIPDLPANTLSPDDIFARKELFYHLRELISTLSPRRQEIITLRFYGGLRNQEIAEVLQLDERTVASHLCRGLDDLQRKLLEKDVTDEQ